MLRCSLAVAVSILVPLTPALGDLICYGTSPNSNCFDYTHEADPAPPLLKIGLAWDFVVPSAFYIKFEPDAKDPNDPRRFLVSNQAGVTPPAAVTTADRSAIRERVASTFSQSGINNIELVDGFVDGGTNVYFADPFFGYGGVAFTGQDRHNSRLEDGVAVFYSGNSASDASMVAHEVGHALGLAHVNPIPPPLALDLEVMDYDKSPFHEIQPEEFTNAVSDIFIDPLDISTRVNATQNSLYHLQRYVNGIPHDVLEANGIVAGTWDKKPGEHNDAAPQGFTVTATTGSPAILLHDVHVFADISGSDLTLTLLDHFDSATLGQISEMSWSIKPTSMFRLWAASTPGGELDVILQGQSEDGSVLPGILPSSGVFNLQYLQVSGSGPATTLATGTANVAAVPEPSAFILGLAISVVCSAVGWYRSRCHSQ